ncbi:putative leader peptide [Streptomyces sp. 900105755]|uniref:Leader peptide n=1 Tax=Streptomyces sp. 900105755 TaxID=3154389 RepID=A0ABV1TRL7_9ACTN
MTANTPLTRRIHVDLLRVGTCVCPQR